MPKFRYCTDKSWYKGNVHIHSVASDGGKTFAELAQMYAEVGYNFLFRTDHWVCSDVKSDMTPYPLLWLDGIELDGHDDQGALYHVLCLGTLSAQTHELFQGQRSLMSAMALARRQGALLILAHPHWTGNTLAEARRWGFHGVEVYNHVCRWLNGKGCGLVHWEAMLKQAPNTLAFSVDDAHIRPEHPGWNGGWIMVNARACTRRAILEALRVGNFYSTCGPEFHAITYQHNNITIQTTPIQFARLVGSAYLGQRRGGFEDTVFTEATFEIPSDWPYAYVEIEDAQGRRAWTNTLFTE